jgi:hypothetical protein
MKYPETVVAAKAPRIESWNKQNQEFISIFLLLSHLVESVRASVLWKGR